MLCVHGQRHGWDRLLAVLDIAARARADAVLDGGRLVARARELGVERIAHLGLELCRQLLAVDVPFGAPDGPTRRLSARVRARLLARAGPLPMTPTQRQYELWLARERLHDRAAIAVRTLFQPRLSDRAIGLPWLLTPLYPLVRAGRVGTRLAAAAIRRGVNAGRAKPR